MIRPLFCAAASYSTTIGVLVDDTADSMAVSPQAERLKRDSASITLLRPFRRCFLPGVSR